MVLSKTVGITIIGASGRMGRALIDQVLASPYASLKGAVLNPNSKNRDLWFEKDAASLIAQPNCGIRLSDHLDEALRQSDVVIDFTPKASRHTALCAEAGVAFVCGTTGLGRELSEALEKSSHKITVVFAANFSLGITVLADLIQQAKTTLGEDYDIEILEMHHRDKRDAPSGTALYLGDKLEENPNPVTQNQPRPKGGIGYAVLRGGGVIGEHQVIFAGKQERLIFTHRAEDRQVFAAGALKAALWAKGKAAGLYSMHDVVGLSK